MSEINVGVEEVLRDGSLTPAVAKAGKGTDLVKGRIAGAKLFANVLDGIAHVHLIAVRSTTCEEPFAVHVVMDRAVRHMDARLRRQQLDNLVLAKSEAHVAPIPK